jgi:branched-chain amino acid transport system substrate-binding protein
MTVLSAEITVDRDGRVNPAGRHGVPSELIIYAKAFLGLEQHSLRFLWRHGSVWLAVQLIKDRAAREPRTVLRASRVELPRSLTTRELDVLTLVALGLTNGGVSVRLGTSARTVSSQIERLLVKLEQGTRGGLAALAVDSGLLRLPIPGDIELTTAIGIVELENSVRGLPSSRQETTRPAYPKRRPLQIGTLVPIGSASADGREVLNGARLAVDELNSTGGAGGRSIELVSVEVDVFDWRSVNRGLDDLFAQDVDAVTTSYTGAEHMPMLDALADYGRPFLHTATYAEQVRRVEDDPSRYGAIFQTCPSETHYGSGMVRLLTDLARRQVWRPRSRRIVSIEAEMLSMQVTTPGFLEDADRAGWSLDELIRVPIGATDWSAVVARLAALDPDVVMVTHFLDQEVAAFQRAFARAGLPALVYCVYGASIPRFQIEAADAADGVIWSTTTGTYDDVLGQRFRREYESRFGVLPGWSQAGASYDQVNLLTSAWSATNSRSTSDVANYLRRVAYRGVNGVYFLGRPGQSTLSYPDVTPDPSLGQAHMIYQIQDGAHRAIGPEPFGTVANFRLPPWCSGIRAEAG